MPESCFVGPTPSVVRLSDRLLTVGKKVEKIEEKERKSPKPSLEVKRRNSVHQLFRWRRRRRRRRRSEQSLSFFSLCGKATSLIILHGIESDQWQREGEETEQKIRKVAAKARSMIRDEGRRPASNPASQPASKASKEADRRRRKREEERRRRRRIGKQLRPDQTDAQLFPSPASSRFIVLPDQHSAF